MAWMLWKESLFLHNTVTGRLVHAISTPGSYDAKGLEMLWREWLNSKRVLDGYTRDMLDSTS